MTENSLKSNQETENAITEDTDDSSIEGNLPTSDQELLDKVQALPKERKREMVAHLEMYSGPIPHPSILKGYEELDAGAAKAIIENGLAESDHRRNLETKRQKRRGNLAYIMLIGSLALCALFILGSFMLIMRGHTIVGSIFGGTGFIILIGSMISLVNDLTVNSDLHAHDHEKSEAEKQKED